MILLRCITIPRGIVIHRLLCRETTLLFKYKYVTVTNNNLEQLLCKHLNLKENQAKYICMKYPVVRKLNEETIKSLIETLAVCGYNKRVLLKEPAIFSILPITLKFRYKVLKECGFKNVLPSHILSYLSYVKKKTIGELKRTNEIANHINVENKLASYLSCWPTSLTSNIYGEINEFTLYTLRLKIIKRYLELILDLSEEEFYRGVATYPTIKHRPLQVINETIELLQNVVMMPNYKIKSNLYLIHADPENLKEIIFKFRSIGGIDIKEIIRMYPRIAVKRCSALSEMRHILQEFQISDEAQCKCFHIYTLGPETLRQRLEKAMKLPEFETYFNHPRFLKMIYSNNTVIKRIANLNNNNKNCSSLSVLTGSTVRYNLFEKAPGDRSGKAKDLVFCISQCLKNLYSKHEIKNMLKRHPFWINIPLVQVKYVYQKLSIEFSPKEIYENLPILYYPWNKISDALNNLNSVQDQFDIIVINRSQKLSLVLYFLEKKHYFSGNGVWTEAEFQNQNKCSSTIIQ